MAQDADLLEDRVLYKIVDVQTEQITMHWRADNDSIIGSLGNLKSYFDANGKALIFAMNGGMFHPDYSPVGLYIENNQELKKINISSGGGNFNLKPNGVFALYNDNTGMICTSETFADDPNIKYATQSGPMLLIDGKFHPAFNKGSANLNIRNGVGILPDGNIVFAISKGFINFYDFALFFKNLGCKNALYLDGAVSQVQYPEEGWLQSGRKFGVLISVTKK
ncbi:MAG: phosphodiester glycosidase family protein [Gilvibacter sp.]